MVPCGYRCVAGVRHCACATAAQSISTHRHRQLQGSSKPTNPVYQLAVAAKLRVWSSNQDTGATYWPRGRETTSAEDRAATKQVDDLLAWVGAQQSDQLDCDRNPGVCCQPLDRQHNVFHFHLQIGSLPCRPLSIATSRRRTSAPQTYSTTRSTLELCRCDVCSNPSHQRSILCALY